MNLKYFLFSLIFLISAITASEPAHYKYILLQLKNRSAQEVSYLRVGYARGVVTTALENRENTIQLVGPEQELKEVVQYIKTHIDKPILIPGDRFGDNIRSK